ncbi:MAG: glycosyltransferase family 1 protein [Candidatus Dormibacteraeota bacterium]|nr:glycosyltransferase family 1 protein [Candidatus Dormibacteraeota bacterium]
MRIAVLAVGTRGDVEPLVALGAGLRAAGHDVTMATGTRYARPVHSAGLAFAPLEGDPHDLLAGVHAFAWRSAGRSPLRFGAELRRLAEPLADALLEEAWAACETAEAIIWTPRTPVGYHAAEALGVPGLLAGLQPLMPDAHLACPPFPDLPLPGPLSRLYNRGGPLISEQAAWLLSRPLAERWRSRLGLRPHGLRNPYARIRARGRPILYGFSPRVVPKPTWGEQVQVTGYWFLPAAGWEVPAALDRFLAAGSAPVGITFGSVAGPAADRALQVALEALAFTGERAVVIGGDLDRIPTRLREVVLPLPDAPFDRLFPRLSMVVHHGGAGTTAAALRAGVPSVIVPFFADQPFWAQRVARMGAAPRPLAAQRVSPADMVGAFDKAMHDPGMRARAALAGRLLNQEDGVANAVRAVERAVPSPAPERAVGVQPASG